MGRKLSILASDWWDYTTLDDEILNDAARLTPEDMATLSREGFQVVFHDTLEDFYLAEALEYITAWKQATPDNPVGICGPIGPTEQLPLVARLVNELDLNLRHAHFWGMDEWVLDGKEVPETHPLSFAKAGSDPTWKCPAATFPSPRPTPRLTSRVGSPSAAPSCRAARATSSTGLSTTPFAAKASTRTSPPRRTSTDA